MMVHKGLCGKKRCIWKLIDVLFLKSAHSVYYLMMDLKSKQNTKEKCLQILLEILKGNAT